MATQIEQDALNVLRAVAQRKAQADEWDVDQIDEFMDAEEVAAAVNVAPGRLSDAVGLLEHNGYAKVLRTMGNEYGFAAIAVTPLGQFEYQRSRAAASPETTQSEAASSLPRTPVPVGSPYGFTHHDWEFVEKARRTSQELNVVFGHQFKSDAFEADALVANVRGSFERAVVAYNATMGHESVVLNFRALSAGYGEHLFNQLARAIIAADVAVFETSDLNPNVMIEMGVALTWGVRVLPIKAEGRPKPPSDVSGQTWADYRDSGSEWVEPEHDTELVAMVERALRVKAAI
jgi:hypothetical protein